MSGGGPLVVVVGGGLAGLSAAIRIAEAGGRCDLVSVVPARRSHSVCAQGGINAAVDTRGEGDSPQRHFEDTIAGGDFLANQALVKAMCDAAPGIIRLLDRMGVPFSRTPEGNLDFRRFGGTLFHRTAFAGATTGQQILYALDEQVRRFEDEGLVRRFEGVEMLSAAIDDGGACRGIIGMDVVTHEVRAFPADAVIVASGGPGLVFGRSTMSRSCTGAAAAAVYRQGAVYANPELIQVHPTAIPGEDKNRLMSESLRGEGGRIWTWRDGKPWYFLEEKYPRYGNLLPRDIATREIFRVVHEMGLGVGGEPLVYLDITHLPRERLDELAGVLEIYEKFVGDDPRQVPMRVFPSVHYSMGGLWTENLVGTERDMMTRIRGLYAAGECEYQFHGANRLGANALLSCIFAGMLAGTAAAKHARGLAGKDALASAFSSLLERERKREEDRFAAYRKRSGTEDVYALHDELGDWMTRHVTVIRANKDLAATDAKLRELADRLGRAPAPDASEVWNDGLRFLGHMELMIELARAITLGALRRDESRGAHYKPEFPERDDARFLKTTLARRGPDGPEISYEDVDTSLMAPRARKYD